MATTVNVRELGRNTAAILDEVEESHRPALVVRNGRPVAALVALDADDLEDYILARAPEFVTSMKEADADLEAGETVSAANVLGELLGEPRQRPGPTGLNADAAVAQIVDLILTQAVRDNASHIHIEPQSDRVRVRYRIGRALREVQTLPVPLLGPILLRVKMMAGMDVADINRAQEGHTSVTLDGRDIDLQITTTETVLGEKVVLKLLDRSR
jgi:type IV pilus assembly protein PilB